MSDSTQHKLKFIRPPRVKLTYDVETEGSSKAIELPFIIGVLSDLAGDNEGKGLMKDASFTEIDRDNFNSFLCNICPILSYAVDNKIKGEGRLAVKLKFASMEDFEVLNIIKQIPELFSIYNAIQQLKEILVKMDGNDDLTEMLSNLFSKKESRNNLKEEVEKLISSEDKKE